MGWKGGKFIFNLINYAINFYNSILNSTKFGILFTCRFKRSDK